MRAFVLFPLMIFVILGVMVLWIALKQESFYKELKIQYQREKWLHLHWVSFQESLKERIKNAPPKDDFIEIHLTIDEHYHYQAIIKRFDQILEKNSLYYIDTFGIYQDSLQTFSLQKDFILILDYF